MYIKKAQIDNFGKFHHETVSFSPGLNVVYGENESGKSTLHSFLKGMLFGLEKQRGRGALTGDYQRYEPWNTASYFAGSLDFSVAGKDFTIERNFYHREKTVRLYNRQDGEELSVEHGDLEVLLGSVSKGFYENTCCIAQAAVDCQESFGRELNRELSNRVHGGESGIDVEKAARMLEQKQKQTEQRQKGCLGKKQERMERLRWEQELLAEEAEQLRQRIAAVDREWNLTDEWPVSEGEQQREWDGSRREPDGFLWRIPVIGWILRFFWRLFHPKAKNARQKEADTGHSEGGRQEQDRRFSQEEEQQRRTAKASMRKVLEEQLQEKESRLLNVQEEMTEALGLTPQERELETELKSIRLAREVLERAAAESYQEGRDDIQASVTEILSGITGGKYDRLEVTEEGEVFLYAAEEAAGYTKSRWENGKSRECDSAREGRQDGLGVAGRERRLRPWQLSRGAMEQLYFALRLGTGRCLMEEEPMPVLLDETFCAYDDRRLGKTLQWLAAQKEQMILFTCQKRELRLLEELGIAHHRIFLSGSV